MCNVCWQTMPTCCFWRGSGPIQSSVFFLYKLQDTSPLLEAENAEDCDSCAPSLYLVENTVAQVPQLKSNCCWRLTMISLRKLIIVHIGDNMKLRMRTIENNYVTKRELQHCLTKLQAEVKGLEKRTVRSVDYLLSKIEVILESRERIANCKFWALVRLRDHIKTRTEAHWRCVTAK